MGMTRILAAALAAVALAALPLPAQERSDPPSRPQFLAAMGLLKTGSFRVDTESVGKPVDLPFTLTLPGSDEVSARTTTDVEGAIVAVEFVGADGALIESVVFTPARVEPGPDLVRRFAMANLLVLQAFPRLSEAYDDARILGFAPVELGEIPGVHLVGTFTGPGVGQLLFRHVGMLPHENGADVAIALVTLSPDRMPIRGDDDLENTFSGWMLRNIVFDQPAAE